MQLILALLLCMGIITLTWVLGSSREPAKPTLLAELKADYQVESAITLASNRIRTEYQKTPPIAFSEPRREIVPGVFLRSGFRRLASDSYKIAAVLTGQGLERRCYARFSLVTVPSTAAPLNPQTPVPTVPAPTASPPGGQASASALPSDAATASPSSISPEALASGSPQTPTATDGAVIMLPSMASDSPPSANDTEGSGTAPVAIPGVDTNPQPVKPAGQWVLEYLPDQGDRDL